MKTLLNIIWIIFGGLLMSLILFVLGIIFSITIIGLPIGLQLFKLSKLVLTPFGKNLNLGFDKHPLINIIWAILFGWELMIFCISIAAIYAITIIGIPFGIAWIKIGILTLCPFGSEVN
ncbi:YccF domain-containing protein [Acholeplasma hippikon]|nr:YccF domain-containing protein [Acholeplasma hippikon]